MATTERLRIPSQVWAPGRDGASGATGYRVWVTVFDLGEGAPMAAEDQNGEVTTQGECTDGTERERSFDALARAVANGGISQLKINEGRGMQ
jgi:hypothetical protein